jgi:hypothetical protein
LPRMFPEPLPNLAVSLSIYSKGGLRSAFTHCKRLDSFVVPRRGAYRQSAVTCVTIRWLKQKRVFLTIPDYPLRIRPKTRTAKIKTRRLRPAGLSSRSVPAFVPTDEQQPLSLPALGPFLCADQSWNRQPVSRLISSQTTEAVGQTQSIGEPVQLVSGTIKKYGWQRYPPGTVPRWKNSPRP